MADSSLVDVTKMKVVDLRKELKSRGLSHTGDKAELVSRLQAAITQDSDHGDINLDSDEIDSDGVLEDDDDKSQTDLGLDESAVELALADQSPPKEIEPKPLKTFKRKSTNSESAKPDNKEGGAKKIVLNRNISVTAPSQPKPAEATESKPAEQNTPTEKVKITADLDPKARLEMRAKRFGLSVKQTDDDRKEARKQRFGQSSNGNTTATAITAISSNPSSLTENFDKLKKRAERFGQSVSKIMTEIEKKELLEKRKQKFATVQ